MGLNRVLLPLFVAVFAAVAAAGPLLYDNGPFVTHPGAGAGGADVSAVQTTLGLYTYGWGSQVSSGYRVADDFLVTDGAGWYIDTITLFGYQTDSGTDTSPFTAVFLQIWDGEPGDPASSVVWGDLVTNRLVSSSWTGVFRALDTDLQNAQRPIFANTVAVGTYLAAGTYWLDWTAGGSLASGPWVPPVTILGVATTGNALQYRPADWHPLVDTDTPQGLPFAIYGAGDGAGIPEPATFVFAGTGLLLLALARRRRRA